jgi:O-antigen ligase/tetratricopeptide (TPR) repeat protein
MKDILKAVVLSGIFFVPFLPLVVSDSLFFPFITGKNFAFRIVVELILAAWVVLAFLDRSYRPRFSWIFGAFAWFIGIMFVANIMGESPHKSMWSNYERMEGFVSLIHLFAYFIVLSTVLQTQKQWRAFFATSIGVAVLMSLYAFGQLAGTFNINQSQTRIDANMGNSAYLAIYMLFHVYLALMLLVQSSTRNMKILFGVLAAVFVYVMLQTGTRGTALALVGSGILATLYVALFSGSVVRNATSAKMRTFALYGLCGVVFAATLFYAIKDTSFIQNNPNLARIASVSFKEGTTRFTIWSLAMEGVKERPILGWGQENFNYVFNKYYSASLYSQEPWFDRVHNLFLDWLIAGGILGLLSFLCIIGAALYYACIRPLSAKFSETFTVPERAFILAMLAGYVAHNLLVFDNLISYTLLVAVVAFVHSRVGTPIPSIATVQVEDTIIQSIVAPTALVIALGTVYMVNIPGLQAASDLIKGFQAPSPDVQYTAFDRALKRGSFGTQEIREQFVRVTQSTLQDPSFAQKIAAQYRTLAPQEQQKKVEETRNAFASRAEKEIEAQAAETPDDVRILVFQSAFYRTVGKSDKAKEVLLRAIDLSEEKQQTHFELGLTLLQEGKVADALKRLSTAFELEPKNTQGRMLNAAAAIYAGDTALRDSLITPEYKDEYSKNDIVLRALYDTRQYDELVTIIEDRIEENTNDVQLRVSLAAVLREQGKTKQAIAAIEKAMTDFPDFKSQGETYIRDLAADKTPVDLPQ